MPTKPLLNVFTMQTGINTKKVVFSQGMDSNCDFEGNYQYFA